MTTINELMMVSTIALLTLDMMDAKTLSKVKMPNRDNL